MSVTTPSRTSPPKARGSSLSDPSIQVSPVTPRIGAKISGIDLTNPSSDQQVEDLHAALAEQQVPFFRHQNINLNQQNASGQHFGRLHIHPNRPGPEGHPEVLPIGADANSKRIAGENWHSDVSCDIEPSLGSIPYYHTVPLSGGDTIVVNQRVAYDALSRAFRSCLDGLTTTRSCDHVHRGTDRLLGADDRNKVFSRTVHPVVRTHLGTKHETLLVNQRLTRRSNELSPEENRAVLDFLFTDSTHPVFRVRFHRQPHSVAPSDNRAVSTSQYGDPSPRYVRAIG